MSINPVAKTFVEACAQRRLTVATAESLTAGLCAATLADVPGASAVLRGGFIVYATAMKSALVGVDGDLIRRHGVVSAEVASALAVGAAQRCGADIGIGLTGVAGPDSVEGHEVGEVFVAVYGPNADGEVETSARCILDEYRSLSVKGRCNESGPEDIRERVRGLAVDCALVDALRHLDR